jgi:hypothetical protein
MPTEKTTELASQAGQVFCVGSRLRRETMSRPLAYSAESLAKKLSARKDPPELREKDRTLCGIFDEKGP